MEKDFLTKVEELRKSINELSVYDMSVYTAIELYYLLANKINEIINAIDTQNKGIEYLLTNGVEIEVIKQLNEWLNDGTMASILNEQANADMIARVNELLTKLDNELNLIETRYKNQFNNKKPFPEVHFLGYKNLIGDCSVIKTENGEIYLVDTGTNDDEEYIISKLQELGITAIKGIFITHSHDDHIGNTNKLIELFHVEQLYLKAKNIKFTDWGEDIYNQQVVHDSMIHFAECNNVEIIEYTNDSIILSDNEKITPLGIGYTNKADYNFESVMLLYEYKATNVLFGGDCPKETQQYILDTFELPIIDLFKLPHHGNNDYCFRNFYVRTQPTNCIFNVSISLSENTLKMVQFYEGKSYNNGNTGERKEVLSFIIGSNCVTTTAKPYLLVCCWDEGIIDPNKTIYFDETGMPVKDRVIRFRGDSYYLDNSYNLLKNQWIEKYKGQQTYYYKAGVDGELLQNKWCSYVGHDGRTYYCYAKSNYTFARAENINIDGVVRRFDTNCFCLNPPENVQELI